jgi:hypothetical protein
MATFAVGTGDYILPFRNIRLKEYPVAVSQTILKGSVLQKAGATLENRVILSTDSITSGIVGIAMEAITTTGTHNPATDKVLVALATPDAEFIGRTVADDAVDFTDLGVNVSLEIDATNLITRVETDDVTNETVKVLEYLNPFTREPLTAEGDVNALAVFKFIPGATIHGPGIVLA